MHDKVGVPTFAGQNTETNNRLALLDVSQFESKMRISIGQLIVMALSLIRNSLLLTLHDFQGVPK